MYSTKVSSLHPTAWEPILMGLGNNPSRTHLHNVDLDIPSSLAALAGRWILIFDMFSTYLVLN